MLQQLLDNIESFLASRKSIRDLETWLISNLQSILNSDDEDAIKIANQVDADLVEFGEGLTSEAMFRERLKILVKPIDTVMVGVSLTEQATSVRTTTDVHTVRRHLETPGPVVEFHLVHKFA